MYPERTAHRGLAISSVVGVTKFILAEKKAATG